MLFARAQIVDCPRNQLLAGAGFAQDEHVGLGRRDGRDLSQDLLNGRALADDVTKVQPDFVLEELIFQLKTFLPLEATERQDGAGDFTAIIPVRRCLDAHPMQLAVLALYLDFKTLSLTQQRMRGRTTRLRRAAFRQEKFITDLAKQFFGRVARNLGGHRVGVEDSVVGVNQHDCLREAFENRAVEHFRLSVEARRKAFDNLRRLRHTANYRAETSMAQRRSVVFATINR